jgi:hypothetical protein
MSEVCILHAADSEGFARKVAAQLAADGYSVVRRDAAPPKGVARLGDAVIVIWSDAMLAAAAMIDSARRALARRILVPVAVGDVLPPASFAHLLPIDMKDWSGDIEDPRWQFVREEVDLARRRGELAKEASPDLAAPKKRRRMPVRHAVPMAAAGSLGAVIAISAFVLMQRPPQTPAQTRSQAEVLALADPRDESTPPAAVAEPAGVGQELAEVPAPPPTLAALSAADTEAAGAEFQPFTDDAEIEPAQDAALAAATPPAEEIALDPSKLPQPVADDFKGAVFRDCADCPDMAEIPAGLGGAAVSRPFAMSRREVRFSDWDACVKDGGCAGLKPDDEGWGRGDRPVVNVSAEDAERYVEWLSKKTGRSYRLPTAEEWRYAAQGTPPEANLQGALDAVKKGAQLTLPAGSYASSVLGVYDMRGNAAEWTSDCAAGGCGERFVVGGAFDTPPDAADAAKSAPTAERRPTIGFRVARDLS